MKKTAIVAILLVTVSLLGCISQIQNNGTQNNIKSNVVENQKDNWCQNGTLIPSIGPSGNSVNFEVKGITNHNGMELCEADYDNNGTMIQYFNENKSYNSMAIKTKNGTIEINLNRVIKKN